MKILIPPSEGKTNIKKPMDIKFGETDFKYMDEVRKVIRLLSLIGNTEIRSIYGTSQEKAELFHRQNQDAFNSRVCHAIDRYTGVVYDHIEWETLTEDAKDFMDKHVGIFSGLFGIVSPKTLIPNYKLKMNVQALQHFWRPILTNILASKILNETVSFKQWVGIFLGFVGALLVLGFDIGNDLPLIGIISSFIALIAITSSTILQKKISNNLPLSVSNLYQAIGGCLFHLLILIFFIDPYINLNTTFLMAMSHQIFLVSFGAFTILMFLIKKNSASKTVSIFFLIPATTAIIAWLFLNETLNNLDIVGFIIATFGVYVATRKN